MRFMTNTGNYNNETTLHSHVLDLYWTANRSAFSLVNVRAVPDEGSLSKQRFCIRHATALINGIKVLDPTKFGVLLMSYPAGTNQISAMGRNGDESQPGKTFLAGKNCLIA
jgi:hypothetical protein